MVQFTTPITILQSQAEVLRAHRAAAAGAVRRHELVAS